MECEENCPSKNSYALFLVCEVVFNRGSTAMPSRRRVDHVGVAGEETRALLGRSTPALVRFVEQAQDVSNGNIRRIQQREGTVEQAIGTSSFGSIDGRSILGSDDSPRAGVVAEHHGHQVVPRLRI